MALSLPLTCVPRGQLGVCVFSLRKKSFLYTAFYPFKVILLIIVFNSITYELDVYY